MAGTVIVTSIPHGVRVAVHCLALPLTITIPIPLTIWKIASMVTMDDLKSVITSRATLSAVGRFQNRLSGLKLPENLLERLSVIMALFGRYFGHSIVRPIRGPVPSAIPSTLHNAMILQLALQQKAVRSVLCHAKAVTNAPWNAISRFQNPDKPYGALVACWYLEILNGQQVVPVEPSLGIVGIAERERAKFHSAGYGYDIDDVVVVNGLPNELAVDCSTARMAPGLLGVTGYVYLVKKGPRYPAAMRKPITFTITANPAAGIRILPKEGQEQTIVKYSEG